MGEREESRSVRRPKRRTRVAPLGCGARIFIAWFWITGAVLLAESWRRGDTPAVIIGLVLIALASLVGCASHPVRLTEARRSPIAEQFGARGWSWRRLVLLGVAATAIILAPATCSLGPAGRGSYAAWIPLIVVTGGVTAFVLARSRTDAAWHQHRAQARSRAADPAAEWTWDFPWDAEGVRKSFRAYLGTRGMYFGRVCTVVGLLLLPVPVADPDDAVILIPLQIAFAIAGSVWLLRSWWILGMGHVVVCSMRFPVHPGGRAQFTVGVTDGGAEIRDAEIVLRHFRESRDGTGPGSGLPLATATIAAIEPLPDGTLPPGVHRPVAFDVPADAPGTAIASANPSYWMLEIRGRTRAGLYEDRFLVPLYARPVAGEVAAADAAETRR